MCELSTSQPQQGITGALFGLRAIARKVRPERHSFDTLLSFISPSYISHFLLLLLFFSFFQMCTSALLLLLAYHSFAPKPPRYGASSAT